MRYDALGVIMLTRAVMAPMNRDQDGQHGTQRQCRGTGPLAWPGLHQALLVEGLNVLAAIVTIADQSNALLRVYRNPLVGLLSRGCTNTHEGVSLWWQWYARIPNARSHTGRALRSTPRRMPHDRGQGGTSTWRAARVVRVRTRPTTIHRADDRHVTARGHRYHCGAPAGGGNVRVTVVPWCGTLCTVTMPPCRSRMDFTRASPSPIPGVSCARAGSTR
jgi:hypothetical protein